MRKISSIGFSFCMSIMMINGAGAAGQVEVMSTSGCGCCKSWVKHLEANGYTAKIQNYEVGELMQKKLVAGIKPSLTSCHTGKIDGYIIEGHVPAREINRLLSERPDAIGLTVPDMPYGSPGMGDAGSGADPYDVLLIKRDGTTEVYASYR